MVHGIFVERLNRFVGIVLVNGKEEKIYIPNTGRLSELAISGEPVLLVPSQGKYSHKLLYFYYNGKPVLIDSTASNGIFSALVARGMVPEFRGLTFIRREPAFENHRFDFLFRDVGGNALLVELKSCTLAWKGVASFPDAVSSRATDHVKALARAGGGTMVFFILHENVEVFVPNYHTDFIFYETLKKHYAAIRILAYSVRYDEEFAITSLNPVKVIMPPVRPAGLYCLVYRYDGCERAGSALGSTVELKKGYYVRTGASDDDVFRDIDLLKRKARRVKGEGEDIFAAMKVVADIPFVDESIALEDLHDLLVKTGGSPAGTLEFMETVSLYYFRDNPLRDRSFWDRVLEMRYGKYRSF
ncbi:MAG: DNA/RNA nuclease SfsA [Spirochaetae bacterium HGW-Spirochaetae-1]|jgi:sugar fermentation stimulation protein A|nr:MAG: DNA/RNA nuclease SfsA [Spirochaetae bacterium HGW-Spirochaetae-1]